MKRGIFFIAFALLLINLAIVSASIGVGVSPSKIYDEMESKQERNFTIVIYNTGSDEMQATMSITDDFTGQAKFYPEQFIVKPEPEPHRLPPVYGQQVIVTIKAPITREAKKFTGYITATAGGAPGSSFGGSGAVAARLEVYVRPPKHFWDYWTQKQVIVGSVVLGILILGLIMALVMKKKGLHLKFVKER